MQHPAPSGPRPPLYEFYEPYTENSIISIQKNIWYAYYILKVKCSMHTISSKTRIPDRSDTLTAVGDVAVKVNDEIEYRTIPQ